MIEPGDVRTPDAIVDAVYRILSGRADEPRDWAGLETLCLPGTRLIPVSVDEGGLVSHEYFDIPEYARSRTPLFAAGDFYERDVGRRVDTSANIAHVWSVYEARRSPAGPPFLRGTGSFQLIHRDARWWIASAIWQATLVDEGP